MEKHYPVVIVGGGPVGMALAVDLGQRGVPCAVIERNVTPHRIPKGQNLTNRTLEHFYFWNCVDELRAARVMPPGYPIGGLTAYGNLMSEYWYAPEGGGGRGTGVAPFYYQRNERLPQYCTEDVLRARIRDLPVIDLITGWNAEAIDQNDNGASVTVVPAGEGDPSTFYSWSADTAVQTERTIAPNVEGRQTITCDYLVGCDGGRSLVRDSLGIDREGRNFEQRMVLAVFRSPELHEILKRFPERTTYRVLKPELQGYWQFFGRVVVGETWFFHAPVPLDTKADNYDFHGLLEEAAGTSFPVEFEHVGFWNLRVMVASQYRKGRVFIAGDAAHQHPPYGGHGLNNGLEDVTNLGWKLAAAVKGWGGDNLLNSYGEERRPIFVETGAEMIAGGIDRDRVFLERYNPTKNKAEFEEAWAKMAEGGQGGANRSFEPNYEGSSVVMGPPGAKCSIYGRLSYEAEAGHHVAPVALSSGRNVYEELLNQEFTLLALGADEAEVQKIEAGAKSHGLPLKTVRDTYRDGREAFGSRLVLVRPDQYVAWAGDQAPADTAAVIKKVAGTA
jgi:2-polyprenyl-6-methoxyphenol hydroxylase-like FAD-dependent oxidoreductase